MEEIKAPKKERKFLKAMGDIALTLFRELLLGVGKKVINKIGNKRQGLVIAFALVAGISYASIDSIPYPITGNKQRLGFQTTGNGLVWRGRVNDTITKPTSYADKNIKAYLILDSVSGSLYVFKQGAWSVISGGSTIDTASLSNRINLKVNISDTANMLLPYLKKADTSILNLTSRFALKLNISDTSSMLSNYATKSYADTSGRFYARQEFRNVSSSTLTWTQTDTLVVNDTTSLQVYRNGQILLPNQYTVPTKTTVVIAAASFKTGENYTVIFPRGGGGGGSGSGSLTSISGGTGITVSPNPITTTGTVSADLTVLMELTDTTLLNLTTRFATKQPNITLTTTGTSGAATFSSNTLNIPQYTGGSGTVTSVGSGYGLLGGPITTTGTLTVDTSTVYDFVRDSIVAVEIGGDTIKILKQEYAPATTDTLTWTLTSKFPIQLRQFILLFRNGQLLLNDQFTVIDTNKVKVAATSYKLGENYTLVTVSGIGSAGVSQTGNPIYPEAGIALSTGTTWATSITNNSSNWNTAFTDRLKWDGGSTGLVAATGRTSLGGTTIGQSMFTLTNPSAITFPRFNADNTVEARSAANFRSDIGAGTVTSVTASGTAGNPISITNNTTTPTIELLSATTSRSGYLTSTDWTIFNNKQAALSFTTPLVNTSNTISINQASSSVNGFLTSTDWTTFNNKQNALSNASASVSGILTSTDWTTFNNKQNALSNASSSVSGILTSTDWTTFNNKQAALSFTTPLVNTSNTISINQASASVSGILTSTDWTTFNNKQNALSNASSSVSGILTSTDWTTFNNKQNTISLTTTGTSGAATLVGATLNIPQYSGGGGGTGTVTSVGLTAPSIFTVGGSPVTTSGTLALTYSGTALPLLNGGTGATTADAALTNFGASAMGKSLFALTNSVSDKFIKVNSNNTITLLNAVDTRTSIGATTRGSNNFTLPDIGSISFLRYNADNSITQLNASDFRTAIGAGTSSTNGTLTDITVTSPLTITNPTTTPLIQINAANGTSSAGVVTTGTQQFGGAKTFIDNLTTNGNMEVDGTMNVDLKATFGAAIKALSLERNYTYSAATTITVGIGITWLSLLNNSTITLTLPNASLYTGKELHIKNSGTGAVNSATSNIQPLNTTLIDSVILTSGGGKFTTLVSDGTNWIKMAGN